MAGETSHYSLQKLSQGDPFSTNGYKFTNADRDFEDRLLWLGAEGHHHTGAPATATGPATAPSMTLSLTGGTIPAGTTVYYKYTLVDANGNESSGSPEGSISTPAQITEPASPTLSTFNSAGSLLPGNYYYVLSAYTTTYTQETLAKNPNYITVPTTTTTNTITLTMPSAPAGATGFNIYRKRPGGANYLYLTSVAAATTTWDDDGSVTEDCNRILPVRNTTNATNAINVCLSGASPVVPVGSTWKVYRTYVSANYDNSFLHWVTEETFTGSGIISPCTEDVGNATSAGKPPTSDQAVGNPSQIDMTLETTGNLAMGRVGHPHEVTFGYFGTLNITVGTSVWVCPAPAATILYCRAALGRTYTAASQDVIVDVNKGTGATPTYSTIYTTQANRPRVLHGQQIGPKRYPDVVSLLEGDSLTVDIDQTGGGATPNDKDLTVTVYMVLHSYPTGVSFVPGTTTGTGA